MDAVSYTHLAIVASGVLPLDQVAGQPLTLVAKNILNPALFTVFMIGGPVLALSSSCLLYTSCKGVHRL